MAGETAAPLPELLRTVENARSDLERVSGRRELQHALWSPYEYPADFFNNLLTLGLAIFRQT